MATIKDISKHSGVSCATISRYYCGTKIVSDELAQKIEQTAKELGYSHKKRAHRNNCVIAVLLPQTTRGFYSEVINEIINQLSKYKLRIVFIPTLLGSDDYKTFLNDFNIEGVIYLDEDINSNIISYFTSKNIKVVMCGGLSQEGKANMVHINDMSASFEATRYLLSLGHRDILFLSDFPKSLSAGFLRITGCKRAFEENGLEFNEDSMVMFGKLTYDIGYKLTKQAIKEKRKFTAIFAFSDEMAMGAMSAIRDSNLIVPLDISVLGFDDLKISSNISPRLTTVHQPIKEFVAKALDFFLTFDNTNQNLDITLPYSIIQRESCIKINNNKGE